MLKIDNSIISGLGLIIDYEIFVDANARRALNLNHCRRAKFCKLE